MKALVIYYSLSGNTRKVATAISNGLKCELEEIKDTKKRTGLLGWLMTGRDGAKELLTKIKDVEKDLSSYDIVMIGGPIWSWNLNSPVRTFLSQYADQIKAAAFFCTEGGSGDKRAFKSMEELLGKPPIATLVVKESEVKRDSYHEKVGAFVDRIRKSA